jgi:ketosteroid isomerase-like protein
MMTSLVLLLLATPVASPELRTRALLEAMQRRDAKAMNELVLDDLTFVTVSNSVIGKPEYVETYTRAMRLASFAIKSFRASIRGGAAATAYVLEIEAQTGSATWAPRLSMSDTWLLDGGQWRLFARHATVMAPPEGKPDGGSR